MAPSDLLPTRGRARRTTRILRVLGFNLLLLLLLALVLEAGTHLLGIHFPALAGQGASDRALWVYDATKGWFHSAGSQGQSFMGGPDAGSVRINSLGWRGKEVARATPGGRRVLVFGDSFVFGVGVDEEHVFTTRLEERLQGAGPYEVVNAGVSGYSTDQEYLLFQERGPALAPDAVVLVTCDNDFEGNTQDFVYQRYPKPYFEISPDGELLLRNSPTPSLGGAQRVKLWLGQHSNLWNAIRSRHSSRPLVQRALGALQVGESHATGADPLAVTAALVIAFRDLAERLGARFVTLNTGHRAEKTPLFHALRPRLRAAGVEYLGLEAVLGDARLRHPERNWDFPGDPHWNVDAHDLAASVVAEYLKPRLSP